MNIRTPTVRVIMLAEWPRRLSFGQAARPALPDSPPGAPSGESAPGVADSAGVA